MGKRKKKTLNIFYSAIVPLQFFNRNTVGKVPVWRITTICALRGLISDGLNQYFFLKTTDSVAMLQEKPVS